MARSVGYESEASFAPWRVLTGVALALAVPQCASSGRGRSDVNDAALTPSAGADWRQSIDRLATRKPRMGYGMERPTVSRVAGTLDAPGTKPLATRKATIAASRPRMGYGMERATASRVAGTLGAPGTKPLATSKASIAASRPRMGYGMERPTVSRVAGTLGAAGTKPLATSKASIAASTTRLAEFKAFVSTGHTKPLASSSRAVSTSRLAEFPPSVSTRAMKPPGGSRTASRAVSTTRLTDSQAFASTQHLAGAVGSGSGRPRVAAGGGGPLRTSGSTRPTPSRVPRPAHCANDGRSGGRGGGGSAPAEDDFSTFVRKCGEPTVSGKGERPVTTLSAEFASELLSHTSRCDHLHWGLGNGCQLRVTYGGTSAAGLPVFFVCRPSVGLDASGNQPKMTCCWAVALAAISPLRCLLEKALRQSVLVLPDLDNLEERKKFKEAFNAADLSAENRFCAVEYISRAKAAFATFCNVSDMIQTYGSEDGAIALARVVTALVKLDEHHDEHSKIFLPAWMDWTTEVDGQASDIQNEECGRSILGDAPATTTVNGLAHPVATAPLMEAPATSISTTNAVAASVAFISSAAASVPEAATGESEAIATVMSDCKSSLPVGHSQVSIAVTVATGVETEVPSVPSALVVTASVAGGAPQAGLPETEALRSTAPADRDVKVVSDTSSPSDESPKTPVFVSEVAIRNEAEIAAFLSACQKEKAAAVGKFCKVDGALLKVLLKDCKVRINAERLAGTVVRIAYAGGIAEKRDVFVFDINSDDVGVKDDCLVSRWRAAAALCRLLRPELRPKAGAVSRKPSQPVPLLLLPDFSDMAKLQAFLRLCDCWCPTEWPAKPFAVHKALLEVHRDGEDFLRRFSSLRHSRGFLELIDAWGRL